MKFAQRILASSSVNGSSVNDSDVIEQARTMLYKELDDADRRLKSVPGVSTNGGLTPDDVKNSAAYKKAKAEYDNAFAAIRKFNTKYKPKRKPRFGPDGKPLPR